MKYFIFIKINKLSPFHQSQQVHTSITMRKNIEKLLKSIREIGKQIMIRLNIGIPYMKFEIDIFFAIQIDSKDILQ